MTARDDTVQPVIHLQPANIQGLLDRLRERVGSFHATFPEGCVILEWWLPNDPLAATRYTTRSTLEAALQAVLDEVEKTGEST